MSRVFADVKKGSKGTDVIVLQSMLRSMQYLGSNGKPLEVDGDAGANTVYAINTFKTLQKKFNVDCGEVNGIFTSDCWKRMGVM